MKKETQFNIFWALLYLVMMVASSAMGLTILYYLHLWAHQIMKGVSK